MTIGEKIQYMRKKAGLSQEELAEAVGVSRQAVSKWETGEATPEVAKLLLLSRAFGVTADWLISDDGPDAPSGPSKNREEPKAEPREETPPPEPSYSLEPEEPRYPNWVESVPGVLGKLLRRFGWLFGVKTALVGALFAAFGFLVRCAGDAFFSVETAVVQSTAPGLGDMGQAVGTVYETGDAILTYGATEAFGSVLPGSFDSITSTGARIFHLFSGFTTGLGIVLLVTGVLVALILRRYREK